jgi:hypothetical protein
MEELKHRFKKIIVFFDNDGEFHPTKKSSGKGKEATRMFCTKFNPPFILLEDERSKDISDFCCNEGVDKTAAELKKLVENEDRRYCSSSDTGSTTYLEG